MSTAMVETGTEVRKTVDQVLADLASIEVNDEASYTEATEFARKIKQTRKIVEDAYADRKAELYVPYKALLDEMKELNDVLSSADKTVRGKMSAYQTAEAKRAAEEARRLRAAEEERRLAEAIETGKDEVLEVPEVKRQAPPVVKATGTYTVESWHFEITDPTKVDPRFMVPDERAIAAYVRSEKGSAVGKLGDGVRVYSTQDVRVKA